MNSAAGTALHAAAEENQVEVVKILVAAGADVEARNDYGLTPLQSALQRGRREAVSVLKEAGKVSTWHAGPSVESYLKPEAARLCICIPAGH